MVTQDVNSDANGNVIIPISPTITLTGPYQSVTALPEDNAALTIVDTHTINVAYHREAFTLAMVRLPEGVNGAYQKSVVDNKANITLRMTRQYNINSDQDVVRFDILYGVKCFPEYATRVLGS